MLENQQPEADISTLPDGKRLWLAILEGIRDGTPFRALSANFGVPVYRIRRRIFQQTALQICNATLSKTRKRPMLSRQVRFRIPSVDVRPKLSEEEARTIADAVLYFSENNTPLSLNCICDLTQDFVGSLPSERHKAINFVDNRPSRIWVYSFINRHKDIDLQSPSPVEDRRTKAVNPENFAKHIVRFETVAEKNGINDPRFMFNLDESGISFRNSGGKAHRKGVGKVCQNLIVKYLTVKVSIDHVTVMPVVSASGSVVNPIVVYPEKTRHGAISMDAC